MADRDNLPPDGPELALVDVVDPRNPLRHSPEKLSAAIMRLYEERGATAMAAARAAAATGG